MNPQLLLNNFPQPVWLYALPNELKRGELELKVDGPYRYIAVNRSVWMSYNVHSAEEACELYSSFRVAEGHCLCTGLGLGLRESWLLRKPEVKSVTVIEKNQCIIDFHKEFNPELLKEIKVINENASEYKGSCDTLLLDHYNQEPWNNVLEDIENVAKNIDCQKMWFWPLEEYLIETSKPGHYFRSYLELKERLPKLPDITSYDVYDFVATWMPTYATRELRARGL